jgi:uncharacterized protein YneF (UPF0154 family)
MKMNKEDFAALICLLLIFFLIGVLVGGYWCRKNMSNEESNNQCSCRCCEE